MFNLQEKFIWFGSKFANYRKMEVKICMTVNKIDTVAHNFCKKFRTDFEMYISNYESQVFISILVDLVCF